MPDNSGVVTVENGVVTAVKEGTANISLKVGGDGVYAENSTTITVTVSRINTTITTRDKVDLKVDDRDNVNATLTPADAGELDYISSDVSVVNVNGIGELTPVADGSATITVIFYGNDKYAPSNATVNVTVSLKDASVSAEDIALNVGDNVTINAVTVPEGLNVTYVPDNSGVVIVENGVVTAVKEGIANITLKVGGDGVYAENSTTITVTVNKYNATADVSITENITVGDNSTVNVVLPDDATGNVTVKVDGEVVDTVPVKDGSADAAITFKSAGSHIVEIVYSGDNKYAPVSTTKIITASKKDTVIISEYSFTRVANDYNAGERGGMFYGYLQDTDGNPLANKTVQIAVNGPIYNVTTDENGGAGLRINLANANTYTYALSFQGDDEYNSAPLASSKLILVKKDTSIKAAAKSFKASAKTKSVSVTLKVSKNQYDGKTYLKSGKKITLKVNGKIYTAKANNKGVAKFNIKLTKKARYIAKISFKGDKTYKAATKSIIITIK